MTIVDLNQAFIECEFPYYKDIEINGDLGSCTVYSVHSKYKEAISVPIMSFEQAIHTLSLAIIKLRSYDMME